MLGLGLGSRWMAVEDDEAALALLEYGLNQGLYYWDTAANYGRAGQWSEERIGRLLPSRRKEVFLVTKVDARGAEAAKASIERSLQRLRTDHIDLLHVHAVQSVEDAENLGRPGQVLEVMQRYREEGVVRFIGFSGHASAAGMRRAAELHDFDAMMIALNHQVKSGKEDFEAEAVPFAAKKGLGVIAMKVVRPRESVAGLQPADLLRYALSLDHVKIANVGTDSRAVLEANLAVIRNFQPLSPEEKQALTAQLDPFFRHEGVAWMQPGYRDGVA